jgi:cobalt-zinc-cadmium resistance protein CzcA
VTPQISPESPTGEIFRYTIINPKDAAGKPIYSHNDLKSLQDWTLERLFRRLPRIIDVTSFGATTKRYEIHPDPARLQRYGITLQQVKDAVSGANGNIGGQYVTAGEAVEVVRGLGLIGRGRDPMDQAFAERDPAAARDVLRGEEERRIREIRQIVLASIDNVPVRIDDVVDGGPLRGEQRPGQQGVVVGHQTRLGHVLLSQPKKDESGNDVHDAAGRRLWNDDDDAVEAIVLLRKGEESLPALRDVEALVDELNREAGRMLPGVKINVVYDRTSLIRVTTETVQENLLVGMALVTVVLLMFLNNIRTAIIIAINVPLALLFAFSMLYLRGKSANLLSIGAVDFGIIVDSSVIMVENIYRHLRSGVDGERPIRKRIVAAAGEIQRSLWYSTAIMVCAFLPLFTMAGPEGQIFGPMADTYAFALAGALLLAVTLSPVLCSLLLGHLKPRGDNFVVRWLQGIYNRQLRRCMQHRWLTLVVFAAVIAVTLAILPFLGREFMPELEEGNLYIRGTFPLNSSLEETVRRSRLARDIMKKYPELETILAQIGRPDDGTDATGFFNAEFFVPLRPQSQWPVPPGGSRRRTKPELVAAMSRELDQTLIGVDWSFSQNIRDNVMEALSGVKGENSVKIIGPDLAELERLGDKALQAVSGVRGVVDAGVFHIMGQSNLEFPIDRQRCARWGVNVADVQDVIATAVAGKSVSQMIEGERSFDIALRWPERLRGDESAILNIPVDVTRNVVSSGTAPSLSATPVTGAAGGPSATGSSAALPAVTGASGNAPLNDLSRTPRRRLGDLVTPLGPDGRLDPRGSFVQPGASEIYREQGQLLIAIKFGVRGRDLASVVAEAQKKIAPLIKPPYRMVWSGEFQEMEEANARLMVVIPLATAAVIVLLYLAFRSLVDVFIVLSNVAALCCGGIWALLLTQTNFSISAAVGFISIFGVGVMNGLLLVSSFHRLRLVGLPMEEAIAEGAAQRLRPMMMTTLTAIFGLVPAALSTRIGAQSQQPLAIVVIGGMTMALLLNQYLTPVLYSIFRRKPPSAESARLAE